ncbi:P-loop containing nucleoside triphosphate hydrolase protein [Diaporthe sp. PMI_573]|nr:P-loop containing nucleoside triphosphate hydrolase protein [Diaporthaceae sp. PMI_573]
MESIGSQIFLWAYPISLCLMFIISRISSAVKTQSRSSSPAKGARKGTSMVFWTLHVFFCCLIAVTLIITAFIESSGWYSSKEYASSLLGVELFYLAGLLPDPDIPYQVSSVHFHIWLVSAIYETAWVICALHRTSGSGPHNVAQLTLGVSRVLVMLCLAFLYLGTRPRRPSHGDEEEESNGLLSTESTNVIGDAQTTTWLDYFLGFRALFPYLWPADSHALQVRAVFCFLLLVAQRVINILAPHQLGVVVASLGPGKIPHQQILLYILFRGLQGQQGVIGSFRAILWIPISQSTYRRLSSATFQHVLHLSLDFHLSKRIGEVMSALSKGGALNTFLDGLVFQLFPMVADLWIAAAYFFIMFDAFYSLMVISVTYFYIYITIYMAKYRGRARREMAKRERQMEATKTDALLSYETVHQSGAVSMEISRYEKLISYFQKAEYDVFFSLNLLNVVQNSVFTLGILVACYWNAYQISMDLHKVATFVTLLTYLAQLQAPLNFFGSFYTRSVQNNLVDAERMLELFNEKPAIRDSENAKDLESCDGKISFSNVSFSYNSGRPALDDVSFDVMPGTSTALVGESGSGKSTILKLLFRFYDPGEGQIKVDGLDMRELSVESLRSHIGVVPQDTVLFNDSLMYNLLYSRPEASKEDVYNACKAASVHHRILSFPNGYSTVVGERGLKLSGGERQRIAIARAFLKSPRILLLDEATASLDSETERQIQGSLERVSEGRTTVVIAHRLSTITKADQILVLSSGRVVERGKHAELLAKNGSYARMWNKQTEGDQST